MIDFSIIRALGGIVARTNSALNGNAAFMARIKSEYTYAGNCFVNGEFRSWYRPGTLPEINSLILAHKSDLYKYPCLFSVLPIRENYQTRDGQKWRILTLDLTLVAVTNSQWTTEQREMLVFDTLLRPWYREFMRQLSISKLFFCNGKIPDHSAWEVFTTKGYEDEAKVWDDYLDYIRIKGLQLTVNPNVCHRDVSEMEQEYLDYTQNEKRLKT